MGVLPGELLCEAVDIHPGEIVLDVGSGDGAITLAADRRGAEVVSTDRVDTSFAFIASMAGASGLSVGTRIADPQVLPFDDDAFDAVLTAFEATYLPDQQRVADELVRVCRPSGRIGVLGWAAGSLIGEVLLAAQAAQANPAGGTSPLRWGDEAHLRELFDNRIAAMRIQARPLTFRYRSAQHMLDWFGRCYGPTRTAFASLEADARAALATELINVHNAYNQADDGTLITRSDYIEVVALVR
jgi:SAM-dependent methyltransferase